MGQCPKALRADAILVSPAFPSRDDEGGEAGANATWSATLTAKGTPKAYTYSAAAGVQGQSAKIAAPESEKKK